MMLHVQIQTDYDLRNSFIRHGNENIVGLKHETNHVGIIIQWPNDEVHVVHLSVLSGP